MSVVCGGLTMKNKAEIVGLSLVFIFLLADPALAHHVMGGRLPVTFADGLLSGLGHPIIGLDHFAAVVAESLLVWLCCCWPGPAVVCLVFLSAPPALQPG